MAANERLEKVQEEIDKARDEAEDAHILDDPDKPRYYKSGSLSDADDQTIVPPG